MALYKQEIDVQYSSTVNLMRRVKEGEKVDVLLTDDLENLFEQGIASLVEDEKQKLVDGVLVGWTLSNIAFDDSLTFLRSSSIKKIGVADPDSCEFGKAAQLLMTEKNVPDFVLAKLKSYSSLRATTEALLKGEVDFVFMSKATVVSAEHAGAGYWFEIMSDDYFPIEHYASKLKQRNMLLTKEIDAYYDFLSGSEASQIFEKYGFVEGEIPMQMSFPF